MPPGGVEVLPDDVWMWRVDEHHLFHQLWIMVAHIPPHLAPSTSTHQVGRFRACVDVCWWIDVHERESSENRCYPLNLPTYFTFSVVTFYF